MSRPRSDARSLPSLTGLRFVLAACVLLCHTTFVSHLFTDDLQTALGLTMPVATNAVAGFFVLSGFVLTWAHVPGESARAFWRRRFWKIFPNHALAWMLAIAFFGIATAPNPVLGATGHEAVGAVAGFFLLQNWVPDLDVSTGFNSPAWSISCEVFFYALFPVLIVLARRLPVRRLRLTWAILVVAVLVLPLIAMAIPGPRPFDWLPINQNSLWFIYLFPPVRIAQFLLGIVTARLVQTGNWLPLPTSAKAGTLLLAALVTLLLPPQYALEGICSVPLALIIADLALRDIEGRPGWLARPAVTHLGEASYALYIIHFPLVLAVRHAVGVDYYFAPWHGALYSAALSVTAQMLALAVYHGYERPLMRRFAQPRGTAMPPGTAPPTS